MSVLLFPPARTGRPRLAHGARGGGGRRGRRGLDRASTPRIKWPNDVRVGGRKIAGILVERGRGPVVGIGLNANVDASMFPRRAARPPPRRSASSRPPGRPLRARHRALIARLDALYGEAVDNRGPGPLDRAWADRREPLGRVAVETSGGRFVGRLADLGPIRGAELVTDAGEVEVIPTAEIRHRRAGRCRTRRRLTSPPRGLTLSVDGGTGTADLAGPFRVGTSIRPGRHDRLAAQGTQHDSSGSRRTNARPSQSCPLGKGRGSGGRGTTA